MEAKRFLIVSNKNTADELYRLGFQMVKSSMGKWVFLNMPLYYEKKDKLTGVVDTNILAI